MEIIDPNIQPYVYLWGEAVLNVLFSEATGLLDDDTDWGRLNCILI